MGSVGWRGDVGSEGESVICEMSSPQGSEVVRQKRGYVQGKIKWSSIQPAHQGLNRGTGFEDYLVERCCHVSLTWQ